MIKKKKIQAPRVRKAAPVKKAEKTPEKEIKETELTKMLKTSLTLKL